ncbi:MAG: RecQ family zinc-binding domain-containing protein [Nitrospirae bacterium]|nr:RecQ family zinc-binding domain-containing protein [Candidatus Manganitrophaceae bacterium]
MVPAGAAGENLFFEVFRTVNDAAKRQLLLQLLREEKGTGLIYVTTAKQAEELYRWLLSAGVSSALYCEKGKAAQREGAQRQFMDNLFQVMVTTPPFGMKIDRPDLRFVVHYTFPDSLERYYEAAGRVGRDRYPARAILLCSRLEDRRIQSASLAERFPHREESLRFYEILSEFSEDVEPGEGVSLTSLIAASGLAERRVKVVAAQLDEAGIVKRKRQRIHQLREFKDRAELETFLIDYERQHRSDQERLQGVLRYIQTTMCRLRYLRNFFGETVEQNCGRCDNCRRAADRSALRSTSKAPLRRRTASSSPRPFRKGEMVSHPTFGEGEVMEGEGEKTTVAFVRGGMKKVLSSYLQKLKTGSLQRLAGSDLGKKG